MTYFLTSKRTCVEASFSQFSGCVGNANCILSEYVKPLFQRINRSWSYRFAVVLKILVFISVRFLSKCIATTFWYTSGLPHISSHLCCLKIGELFIHFAFLFKLGICEEIPHVHFKQKLVSHVSCIMSQGS